MLRNAKGKSPFAIGYDLPAGYTDSLASPSGRFMIYYDTNSTTADSNTTLAFAEQAAVEADSAYAFEIQDLGYTAPEFTSDNHYNIYLAPLHSGDRAYGATYTYRQLSSSPSGNERWRTFTQVDDQFHSHVYATLGYDALRITIFHEFFHATQFSGYGTPPSLPNYIYFQEMSSVWMEWLSTPRVKDYLQYVGSYLSHLNLEFDLPVDVGEYGEYLYFAYLTKRFQDTSIIKKIWTYYRDSSTDPIACIDAVLHDYGSSFCNEYQNFGAQLMQVANPALTPDISDPTLLPIGSVPITEAPMGQPTPFTDNALSLNFISTSSGNESCLEVFARDTDRAVQSTATITFPGLGTPPNLTFDIPTNYCDTELCTGGVQVYPNPFISTGSTVAYLLASTGPNQPASVAMNILGLDMNEIRSTKVPAVAYKGSWDAVWDGRDDNGKLVPSGEYFYTLHVDGMLKVGKVIVVKK